MARRDQIKRHESSNIWNFLVVVVAKNASLSSGRDYRRKIVIVEPHTLTAQRCYRLLTGIVVPRPIAWVTTLNAQQKVNVAPFSAFTFVSPKPPLIGITVGRKGGVYKDTARNILAHEHYVIHIADRPLLGKLHASAEEFPPDVSEAERLDIRKIPSDLVATPRIAAAPIAMECKLRHMTEYGDTRSRFLVGEVVRFHIRDGLVKDDKIQTLELDPICRLGGPNYANLGKVVTMPSILQTPKSDRVEIE
jgi:flavin reductase (DIM6/NTAB) family NADH-FMN oxidoreductase RutF